MRWFARKRCWGRRDSRFAGPCGDFGVNGSGGGADGPLRLGEAIVEGAFAAGRQGNHRETKAKAIAKAGQPAHQ